MILVISPQKVYATKRLTEEAAILGIPLEVLPAEEVIKENFDIYKYSCLYVRNPYIDQKPAALGQILALAKKFKANGKRVVDTTIAEGKLAEGKWVDYEYLK